MNSEYYSNELIYIDIINPLYSVYDSSIYFIYFHYNKTKEIEYYSIRYKSKVLIKFKYFQLIRYNRIIRFRMDNDSEYILEVFQFYFTKIGILFELSVPYNS